MTSSDKKTAIRKAAIRLINSLGLAGVSMSKIAKEANVSPATIYLYFENKEDMINELYLGLKYEMSLKYFKDFDPKMPIKEGFKKLWYNLVDYVQNNPENFSFIEQYHNSPLINNFSKEKIASYFEPLNNLFERGIKEGVIKNHSFGMLHIFSCIPILNYFKEQDAPGFVAKKEDLEGIFEMTWDALSTK